MLTTSPTFQILLGKEYADFLLTAIDGATRSIDILMFDWRWYPLDPSSPVQLINQALARARKRGVKIRVLVDSGYSLKYFKELQIEVRHYERAGLLHAKNILIDGELVVLGSHNMTMNALTQNVEISVAIIDPASILVLTNYFNSLWQ
jgi:phosphatidylserine/phosphatidylglycerophosphate/cardiolipin synthase-like enzyme